MRNSLIAKSISNSVEIRSKISTNSVEHRVKIVSKPIKNRPNWLSEAFLVHLGLILGPKTNPRSIFGRFWEAFGGHFGVIFRSKFSSFFAYVFGKIVDSILIDFGCRV